MSRMSDEHIKAIDNVSWRGIQDIYIQPLYKGIKIEGYIIKINGQRYPKGSDFYRLTNPKYAVEQAILDWDKEF